MELEDVFRAYQRPVFAYFLRLTGRRQDAEELTQETFFRACGAAVRFQGRSSIGTWLFGIARRVLLEAMRAGLFEHRPELPESAADAPDTDERLDLERAFATLSLADREVLMLVEVLGFAPVEAAPMTGVTPEALRVRLHRARLRLREAYTR